MTSFSPNSANDNRGGEVKNLRSKQCQVADTSNFGSTAGIPQVAHGLPGALDPYDAAGQFFAVYGDMQSLGTQLEYLDQFQSSTKTYTPSDLLPNSFPRSQSETSGLSQAQSRNSTGTNLCALTGSKAKRSRERNRVAARKCRQKAKVNTNELRERERIESQRNQLLSNCVVSLRGEVINLKSEILRHSDCNSKVIRDYIQKAACDISSDDV
ncbi:uncharacterized protein F4822DRAFT_432395 [Hypoxylon trugodes]|uniref:uncharacterized protein n=1 Tax=Hypoxylon trugodes TaxID=326681 RepID=UPI00219F2A33|nr:uncharacterized protein F4822DRAFT_432395 [Hypoxylon trugodes]KAI1385542.1 hypothetical protein F4822DRAFT_432395 [Hypoxylon trugodes]